ncbi:MAG: alpha/beta hydrolase [Clostridia bacterium]|nr:alpha/beta hydrolase [Clostridia bacterium]
MSNIVDRVVFDDFEMKYIRFGNGEKTLVIIPGLSVQSVIPAAPAIEKRYEIFESDFTVYLFDRRSDLPARYTVYDIARDTAHAMKRLGPENVCLFGTSQGGMVAQVIAAEHPELVEKLALVSTTCRVGDTRFSVIDGWIKLAREGKTEELFLSFGEKIYPETVFNIYRSAFVEMAKSVTDDELNRFIVLAEGMRGFDVKDGLGSIACPVLVVGDDTDEVLGADAAAEIASALKDRADAEMLTYSSFGHAVYDTAPDFPKKLYDFFMK